MAQKSAAKDSIEAEALANEGLGPEATGQRSAATLEEAMALQDQLGREANGTAEPTEAEMEPEAE